MRAKTLGVLFTAALFAATVAFAQNNNPNSNNPNSNSNSSATTNQSATENQNTAGNAANPETGTQGNVMMGRVTKYTSGQSITVKMQNGRTRTWNLNNPNETANVSPDVKVGSRVQVSETSNNGQKTLNIEPATGARTGAATGNGLPKTASNAPLFALLGLLSLAGAAGVRLYAKKLA